MSIALAKSASGGIADISQTWRDGRLTISLIQLQVTVQVVGPAPLEGISWRVRRD